jgi:hypothetical protein
MAIWTNIKIADCDTKEKADKLYEHYTNEGIIIRIDFIPESKFLGSDKDTWEVWVVFSPCCYEEELEDYYLEHCYNEFPGGEFADEAFARNGDLRYVC